mmetsp:Transcript_101775/g.265448  ORF Transcript_101775/g.265448 Transcript_101775/m.265448 type:complete len:227 (-) Transcript_101775:2-682(-)
MPPTKKSKHMKKDWSGISNQIVTRLPNVLPGHWPSRRAHSMPPTPPKAMLMWWTSTSCVHSVLTPSRKNSLPLPPPAGPAAAPTPGTCCPAGAASGATASRATPDRLAPPGGAARGYRHTSIKCATVQTHPSSAGAAVTPCWESHTSTSSARSANAQYSHCAGVSRPRIAPGRPCCFPGTEESVAELEAPSHSAAADTGGSCGHAWASTSGERAGAMSPRGSSILR